MSLPCDGLPTPVVGSLIGSLLEACLLRYAELMRAEDQFGDVEMVTVGSDELFALTEGAQALVVLFKCVVSESLCKLLACL